MKEDNEQKISNFIANVQKQYLAIRSKRIVKFLIICCKAVFFIARFLFIVLLEIIAPESSRRDSTSHHSYSQRKNSADRLYNE